MTTEVSIKTTVYRATNCATAGFVEEFPFGFVLVGEKTKYGNNGHGQGACLQILNFNSVGAYLF